MALLIVSPVDAKRTRECGAIPRGAEALTIGDSRLNGNRNEEILAVNMADRGFVNLDPAFSSTTSGARISDYLSSPHPLEGEADLVLVAMGVNDWPAPEGQVGRLTAHLTSANPDVVIVWQSEYVNLPLMESKFGPDTARRIQAGAEIVNAELADAGVCVSDWAMLNEADPWAYLSADPADGVHVYGNEAVFVGELFTSVDDLRLKGNSRAGSRGNRGRKF